MTGNKLRVILGWKPTMFTKTRQSQIDGKAAGQMEGAGRQKMGRIIFATGNEGKMREIRMIMADMGMEILSMREAGIQVEAEENGRTYEENALIKARAVAAHASARAVAHAPARMAAAHAPARMAAAYTSASAASDRALAGTEADSEAGGLEPAPAGDIVLADDSGLEVDFLNKEPGIYSARYLGEDTPYSIKNAEIIRRLEGVTEEKRSARFVCAIAAVLPDGREITVRATIEGRIGYEEKGSHGFGYDPIFYVPELGKYTAELTEEEKNKISHRGKALRLMKEELKKL